MKKAQLVTLAAVLAVTGGAAGLMLSKRNKAIGGAPPEAGKPVLKDFRPADVYGITVKDTTSEVTIEQKNGKWVVAQRDDFPASPDVLNELRDTAWTLKIADAQKLGPSQLGSVKLVKPGEGTKQEEEGILVTFRNSEGRDIAGFIAGKVIEPESNQSGFIDFGSRAGKSQYVKVLGVDDYVYRAQDGFSRIETKPAAWLDKSSFFKIEKIRSVSVTGEDPDETWKVERKTEGGPLELVDAKEGEDFDPSKASGAGSAFAYVQFVDVALASEREKTGVDSPQRTAVIETFDGFTYTIRAGNMVPKDEADTTSYGSDNYYLAYSVEGKFQEKRTPPPPKEDGSPGETEEEKKKADEEFANQLKAKKEKLAAEQAHKDRVFAVARYALDPILKKRSELMKDAAANQGAATTTPANSSAGDSAGGGGATTTPAPTESGRIEAVTPPVEVRIPPKDPADEKADDSAGGDKDGEGENKEG